MGERELFVREAGSPDAPPLLLLHGWSFDGEMAFFNVIPGLADRFRVIVPDHRGHGRSDWIRGPYEIADVADDVAGVMDELGIAKANVFGYSMGGLVAQEFAHRHPDRVSRMLLAATAAYPIDRMRGVFRVLLVLGRAIARVSRKEFSTVSTTVLTRTGSISPSHVRWMWEALMRRDPNMYYWAGDAVRRFDSRAWIGSLAVPARVVVNSHDQLMRPRTQRHLASYFSADDVFEITGGRHESIMNRAPEYVKLAGEFFEGDRSGTA